MPGSAREPVTALLCTCDRGDRLIGAVESILANRYPHFELIIVDQSRDDRTARAVASLLPDPRLRLLRSARHGLGYARNIGLAQARADLVAMTDDDCTVPANWLEEIASVFQEDPAMAVLFCGVSAVPHDPSAGFVPTFLPRKSRRLRTLADFRLPHGIGAGMAVRRSAVLQLGGFDALTGAGARFPSYEDVDVALRALLRGYTVGHTDRVTVCHDGFRNWAEGRHLVRRDFQGIGAVHAKLLRCAGGRMLPVILRIQCHDLLTPAVAALARGRRPRVGLRLTSYVRGVAAGWRCSIDPACGRFACADSPHPLQGNHADARPIASLALPDR